MLERVELCCNYEWFVAMNDRTDASTISVQGYTTYCSIYLGLHVYEYVFSQLTFFWRIVGYWLQHSSDTCWR